MALANPANGGLHCHRSTDRQHILTFEGTNWYKAIALVPETRYTFLPPRLLLDFDLAGLRLGRLGQPDGENAVSQLGIDLLGVGVRGQGRAVGELAMPVAERLARVLLGDLPGDAELVAAQLDVDVVALHPGQFGADDVGVLGLLGF